MISFEDQMEAHPILNNQQLWTFDVKSKDFDWTNIIAPLSRRREPVFLGDLYNSIKSYDTTGGDRMHVLVCHDMMGNYLEDRHFSSSKKFDDYRFMHWSGIDYFCYFSHKYITIPPSNWINAAHKHGVAVLGTFITEWSDGESKLLEVLSTRESVDKTTNALLKCCQHFKFEGWLINVECKLPATSLPNLLYFLKTLREKISKEIPFGKVFWYDSITKSGDLNWQNAINDKNLEYFLNSDGTFINYSWNDSHISKTDAIIEENNEVRRKAFFGIDIFGRGQIGGFETHRTLSRITNFSVAFFATGWTYEKLNEMPLMNIKSTSGHSETNILFLQRNEYFWHSLWKYLPTFPYVELPFLTYFCTGSGENFFRNGQQIRNQFFVISSQCLQPSVPIHLNAERYFKDAVDGGSCLRIVRENELFRIFLTDFNVGQSMIISYAFKLDNMERNHLDIVVRFECEYVPKKDCYLFLGGYTKLVTLKGRCYIPPIDGLQPNNLDNCLSENGKERFMSNNLQGNWSTRTYLFKFEKHVIIKDIGVLYRKDDRSFVTNCLLGGIYVDKLENIVLPKSSSFININIVTDDLML